MAINQVRVIAGPNGSGKTTLYFFLKENISTGIWLNADELLEQFERKGFIEYSILGFLPDALSFKTFCKQKSTRLFVEEFELSDQLPQLMFGEFSIIYSGKKISNQLAALLTDFFRYCLLKKGFSFTTETVFSHQSKLAFVKEARKNNYRTYLYFIATSSPEINIQRVKSRVYKGGHAVPDAKVKSRYLKSILLLRKSIPVFDRVYIFDNSGREIKLIVSYEKGKLAKVHADIIPAWLTFLINKKSK